MEEITIKVEHITTFDNFVQWVNKASSRIGGFKRDEQIICIDKNGNSCTCGKDFQYADEHNYFPIKAYRLIRCTE